MPASNTVDMIKYGKEMYFPINVWAHQNPGRNVPSVRVSLSLSLSLSLSANIMPFSKLLNKNNTIFFEKIVIITICTQNNSSQFLIRSKNVGTKITKYIIKTKNLQK